ncbi:MAG: cob(I)yrinic acid a,c-diamide adenosyltransferase [Gammaproteobacteria bacterium]
MGHRLSKIYTRTGDDGTTGLGDGTRTAKSDRRIHAIGEVDELNSLVGVLLAEDPGEDISGILHDIQHGLFDLGGELSIPGSVIVRPRHVDRVEKAIDRFNASLPPLKDFILPGGGKAPAVCHLARAVARRAERTLTGLGETEDINAQGRIFLNRISDLLFVLARVLARRSGAAEVLWDKDRLGKD